MTRTSPRRARRALTVGAVTLAGLFGVAACVPEPAGPAPSTSSTSSTTSSTVACGSVSTPASDATPGGADVTVTPSTDLCRTGQVITVSGSGFNPTANNSLGIYVVYGPYDPATFSTDASVYGASKWVHLGGPNSGGQAPMNPDGTFSTTLTVPAQYTDGGGNAVDCTTTQCSVITFTAHGVTDRSQDAVIPVSFN